MSDRDNSRAKMLSGITLFLVAGLALLYLVPGSWLPAASGDPVAVGDPLLHGQGLWDPPVSAAAPALGSAQLASASDVEELSEAEWEYTLVKPNPKKPRTRPVSKFRR